MKYDDNMAVIVANRLSGYDPQIIRVQYDDEIVFINSTRLLTRNLFIDVIVHYCEEMEKE